MIVPPCAATVWSSPGKDASIPGTVRKSRGNTSPAKIVSVVRRGSVRSKKSAMTMIIAPMTSAIRVIVTIRRVCRALIRKPAIRQAANAATQGGKIVIAGLLILMNARMAPARLWRMIVGIFVLTGLRQWIAMTMMLVPRTSAMLKFAAGTFLRLVRKEKPAIRQRLRVSVRCAATALLMKGKAVRRTGIARRKVRSAKIANACPCVFQKQIARMTAILVRRKLAAAVIAGIRQSVRIQPQFAILRPESVLPVSKIPIVMKDGPVLTEVAS